MKSRPLQTRLQLTRLLLLKGTRFFRRFTPLGRFALLGYAVTLPFVISTRATLNYQLFACCCMLLLLAVAWGQARAFRTHQAFAVSRRLPRHAMVGDPVTFQVTLQNRRDSVARSMSYMEDISWRPPPPLPASDMEVLRWCSAAAVETKGDVAAVAPHGETSLTVTLTPRARGVLAFRGGVVGLQDPLGLYLGTTFLEVEDTLLVLPRTHPCPALRLRAGRRRQPGDIPQTLASGDAQEFAGLREYQPGDSVRRIHWPSLARFRTPKVKEYHDEYVARLALALDTFPHAHGALLPHAVFEAAVSVAASLTLADRPEDSLLDLLFIADETRRLTAGRGRLDAQALLEAMAGAAPCFDKDISTLQEAILSNAPHMSGVACVLLGWDEPRRRMMAALRAAGLTTDIYVVTDETIAREDGHAAMVRRIRPAALEEDLCAP